MTALKLSCRILACGVLAGALLLGGSRAAWAARGATVDLADTEVFEGPGTKFKVVEKLPKGTALAASNLPIEGFFKVRTSTGLIGWVAADALVLQPPALDSAAAGGVESLDAPGAAPAPMATAVVRPIRAAPTRVERGSRQLIRIRALGGGYLNYFAGVVSNYTSLGFGGYGGGEVAFNLTPNFAAGVRVDYVMRSFVLTDLSTPSSPQNYQIDMSALPVIAGMEYQYLTFGKFSSRVALFGGLAVLGRFQSMDLGVASSSTNESLINHVTFTGLLKVDLNWQFSRYFSVFAEAGYRYLRTVEQTPSPSTNSGAAVLESRFILDHGGGVFGGGVSFSF